MDRIELGDECRDTITGFEGVAVAATDWLYGCRRITLQPRKIGENGKPVESQTFDEPQLRILARRSAPRTEVLTGGPGPEPTRNIAPL